MGDKDCGFRCADPNNGQAAIGLVNAHPPPRRRPKHFADKPRNHKVVGNEELVGLVFSNRQPFRGGVSHLSFACLDFLLAHPAIKRLEGGGHLGGRSVRDAIHQQGGGLRAQCRKALCHRISRFNGPLEGGSEDVGKRHTAEPLSDHLRLTLPPGRKWAVVDAVLGVHLFAVSDQIQVTRQGVPLSVGPEWCEELERRL